jgi:hypothetical protein
LNAAIKSTAIPRADYDYQDLVGLELTPIGLPAYWQVALALLGTIRARLADG